MLLLLSLFLKTLSFKLNGMEIKLQVAGVGSYQVKRKESGSKHPQNQNLAGNESGFIIIFLIK